MPQHRHIKIVKIVQKEEAFFELFLVITTADKDEEKTVIVSDEVLTTLGILKPRLLDETEYQRLLTGAVFAKAYHQALHYLSYRKRSVAQVETQLLDKHDVHPSVIRRVIDKLSVQGYLDDVDFVQSYIQTALKTSLKGPSKLHEELRRCGCDEAHIEQQLATLFPLEKQEEQLLHLFDKMQRKKYFSTQQLFDKYNQKALTLGYAYDTINKIKRLNTTTAVAIDDRKIQQLLEREHQRMQKKKYSVFEQKQKMKQKLRAKGLDYTRLNTYITTFYQALGLNEDE